MLHNLSTRTLNIPLESQNDVQNVSPAATTFSEGITVLPKLLGYNCDVATHGLMSHGFTVGVMNHDGLHWFEHHTSHVVQL
jgi:hypothetical protein